MLGEIEDENERFVDLKHLVASEVTDGLAECLHIDGTYDLAHHARPLVVDRHVGMEARSWRRLRYRADNRGGGARRSSA